MALVITIIVLLILAGISIGMLTGDNGIIKNSKNAKEQTEIASEKEVIDQATIEAMGRNKRGNLVEEEFQEAMDRNTKKGDTEVTDIGDEFEVYFNNSNRYYIVNKDGNILDYEVAIKDPYPGDITKDENGENLDGTESKPYEIWCIEDLCDFSNRVNTKDSMIKGTTVVKLMQNLDFKSNRSYKDGKIVTSGLIPSCNSVEELKTILTTGEGFVPIGIKVEIGRFMGTFEGNNKEIRNLYIYTQEVAGLFGQLFEAKIYNLGVTGNITSTNNYAGGIAARGNLSTFSNCYNKATIISETSGAGGVVGNSSWQGYKMNNCFNLGNVTANSYAAGIAAVSAGEIYNCYNKGNITSKDAYAGGIIGEAAGSITIKNSYNEGSIKSYTWKAAGIVSDEYAGTVICENCYNIGIIKQEGKSEITGANAKGIGGKTIINCYNFGKVISEAWNYEHIIGEESSEITNCYYNSELVGKTEERDGLKDVAKMKKEEIINLLNSYQEEGNYPSDWKKWKLGENGYPTFE